MIDVFVSSDENSISSGSRWLDNITNSLKECSIELILCSPQSIIRPWINFEAGAGWIRDIPVIPLCHSGMTPEKLPIPLNLLQAAKISEISSLKFIIPVLANAIGAHSPNVSLDEFVNNVKKFEENYTFWNSFNDSCNKIKSFHKEILPNMKNYQKISIDLTEVQITKFENIIDPFLAKNNLVSLRRTGSVNITNSGMYHGCEIIINNKMQEYMNDDSFYIKS